MKAITKSRGFVRIAEFAGGRRVASSLYVIWRSMRERCLCITYRDYHYYGGRGIAICPEWSDFAAFRAWALSSGFRKGLTLDRMETNGNYEPGNCRWIPKNDQQLNTRRVAMLTVNGETKALPIWARQFGLGSHNIRDRLKYGWSHERAVTTPLGAPRPTGLKYKPRIGNVGR